MYCFYVCVFNYGPGSQLSWIITLQHKAMSNSKPFRDFPDSDYYYYITIILGGILCLLDRCRINKERFYLRDESLLIGNYVYLCYCQRTPNPTMLQAPPLQIYSFTFKQLISFKKKKVTSTGVNSHSLGSIFSPGLIQ